MEALTEYATSSKFEIGMYAILLLSAAQAATMGLTPGLLGRIGFCVGLYVAIALGAPFENLLIRLGAPATAAGIVSPIATVALCTFAGWALSVSFNAVLMRMRMEFLSHALGLCYGLFRAAVLIMTLVYITTLTGVLEREQFKSSALLRASGDALMALGQSERTPQFLRKHLSDFDYNRPLELVPPTESDSEGSEIPEDAQNPNAQESPDRLSEVITIFAKQDDL